MSSLERSSEVKYKNLEFCQKDGRDPEIICWVKQEGRDPYCYTLLWWRRGKEGWHIEFVGARPLEQERDDIWNLMKYGQSVLDAMFELEQA
jgi:hypothetical protein